MNENTEMVEAMELAMKDTTVKERYFLTPAALFFVFPFSNA